MPHLGTPPRKTNKTIQVADFKLLTSELPSCASRVRTAPLLVRGIGKAQFHADKNRTTPEYKKKNCPRHFRREHSFVFSLFTVQFYFLKACDKNRVIKCAYHRRLENHLVPLYKVSMSTKNQITKGIWGGDQAGG